MSDWLTWWFILGGAVAVVSVAFLLALIRQVILLGRTARRMRDELSPVMSEVASEAARASRRGGSMQVPSRSGHPD